MQWYLSSSGYERIDIERSSVRLLIYTLCRITVTCILPRMLKCILFLFTCMEILVHYTYLQYILYCFTSIDSIVHIQTLTQVKLLHIIFLNQNSWSRSCCYFLHNYQGIWQLWMICCIELGLVSLMEKVQGMKVVWVECVQQRIYSIAYLYGAYAC